MVTYKTPGVYVEELSTLPPSVAQVATAIPAFIGYTEKQPEEGDGVQVKRVDTLLDYETAFGKGSLSKFAVEVNQGEPPTEIKNITRATKSEEFRLYDSVDLYFKNGGGGCYIVSIGTYDSKPDKSDFKTGLKELQKEDEPTLIVLTDAILLEVGDYYELAKAALDQCKTLGDRFVIFDVLENKATATNDITAFRGGIGTSNSR